MKTIIIGLGGDSLVGQAMVAAAVRATAAVPATAAVGPKAALLGPEDYDLDVLAQAPPGAPVFYPPLGFTVRPAEPWPAVLKPAPAPRYHRRHHRARRNSW